AGLAAIGRGGLAPVVRRRRAAHGRDLQADGLAGVVRHLHGVLAAGVFVDHVPANGAVLVRGLGAALGHVLHVRALALGFDAVADQRAAQRARRHGGAAAHAAAELAADGGTGDRADDAARARGLVLHEHLLV